MSVARAAVRGDLASAAAFRELEVGAQRGLARVARGGVIALIVAAPFEALRPVLRVPGQSLSSVEAVLLAVGVSCAWAAVRGRTWPRLTTAGVLPWSACLFVAFLSASLAPVFRGNALHMAARAAVAAVIWAACAIGAESESSRRQVVLAAVGTGAFVAVLVVADFAGTPGISRFLGIFRVGTAVVGAQVRASGPFQYPTIASMYLEVTFALGLGLLASSRHLGLRPLSVLVASLAVMSEAIVLTFTRSGLITVVLSLIVVGGVHWYRRGTDRALLGMVVLVAALVLELVSSRSAEMLRLRLTTEGQGRWFSAVIEPPAQLALDTRRVIEVPVTLTNTGRATWDSSAAEPILLSYHWIADDSDEVIAWEGTRTPFERPIGPGQTVTVTATVGGPGRPGHFRLLWDIEQRQRLWFSTEPDADLVFSEGAVTGPVTEVRPPGFARHLPKADVRPGRLVLWTAAVRMFLARPLLGVGPDNFRLLYGQSSNLRTADPRVHSNNMYLEVLAGLGLIGATAFLWLGVSWATAAVAAAQASGLGLGIAAASAAIAVHGLADSFLSFTGTYIVIAVVCGLASACGRDGGRHAHRV